MKKVTSKNLRLKKLTDLQLKEVVGGAEASDKEKADKAEKIWKDFDVKVKGGSGHALE